MSAKRPAESSPDQPSFAEAAGDKQLRLLLQRLTSLLRHLRRGDDSRQFVEEGLGLLLRELEVAIENATARRNAASLHSEITEQLRANANLPVIVELTQRRTDLGLMAARNVQPVDEPGMWTNVEIGERVSVLIRSFEAINDRLRDWHARSHTLPDDVVLRMSTYYQRLCRRLDNEMAQFQQSIREKHPRGKVDLRQIESAREALAVMMAYDSARLLESQRQIATSKTHTLEELRRELQSHRH